MTNRQTMNTGNQNEVLSIEECAEVIIHTVQQVR